MKNEIKEAAVVTKDTVTAENAIAKFEVGKVYWASAGHRVIAVKRTAHYVTFNLLKVELEAGQNYFDAEAMTWLKASNVRVKVTKTGNGETCYIKGYEENRAIVTNADMTIEIVGDEENEVLTVDYNFDDEEDDDELIDPAEEKAEVTDSAASEVATVEEVTKVANVSEDVIAEKEVALACLKANVIENLKWIDELSLRGWESGFVYEPVAKKAAENAQTYIKIAYARIADAENEIWNVALEIEEAATPAVEEVPVVDEDASNELIDPAEEVAAAVVTKDTVSAENANIAQEEIAAMIEGEMDDEIEFMALATVGEVWDYAEIGTPEMTAEEKYHMIEIAEEVMLETAEERKAKNKEALLAEIEKIKGMDAEIFNVAEEVAFEIGRFGEDNAIAQKFSAVVDLAIEEFASQVKGIIAAIKGEDLKFDAQLFNGEDTTVEEVATPAKFEVGKIYYGKISTSRVYVEVKVVKRTAKFVTVVDYSEDYEYIDYDEAERHRIQIDNKGELIELNDDFGAPYYVRANHSEPPKKYKDKYGQEGYYFEDDTWIPEEVTATKETAVEEVPVVDEETKLRGEYAELDSEIDALEKKLQELQGRRLDVGTKLSNVVRSKIEETFQKAKEAIKKAAKVGASIELRVAKREGYYWIEGGEEWEDLLCSVSYNGDVMVEIGDKEVVRYKDKWEGTAAIEGLIAAIERGDEIYTFPADDANNTANA